ncbi:MAG TPA: hypothetical protein VK638_59120 [Edaphobacter sp.]|nr:hypothetical protein [Edaphobacter sp.]
MKKLLFAVMLAIFLGSTAHAQAATSIAFTWTNNNNGLPNCSTSVTTACLVGQTLTDTTAASSPVVLSSTISPTATTFTTPLPAFTAASRTYSLVVNYKDASGAAQATTAATATVGVPFLVNAPTGFSATTK